METCQFGKRDGSFTCDAIARVRRTYATLGGDVTLDLCDVCAGMDKPARDWGWTALRETPLAPIILNELLDLNDRRLG